MVQTPRHSPALPLALTLALTLSLTLSLALSSSGQGCALELAQRVGDEAHRVRCTGTDRLVHGVGQDGLEVVQLEVLVHLHSAGREAVASGRGGCGEGCGAWAGERTSSGVIAPHRTRVALKSGPGFRQNRQPVVSNSRFAPEAHGAVGRHLGAVGTSRTPRRGKGVSRRRF